ncbi:unnamed protein product [Mytilus edulis]|uniref:Endonuclease/exonuclease/phosphatase domain-containing protein n=1 Tax=Mytilus edulis TaxID=6550 RepID=A0A8S3QC72_MYTED|nr:unnamed protein product [Mytilus edulis]
MKTNLSIGSWNIQGLGGKLEDDYFLSSLKYDINILMETWKGADSSTNIVNFNYVQKSRKKKLRSKRYSGGIIVYYKSTLHKGISEVLNVTKSDNRLWLKLDKFFFGLKKDIYVCACYIPPLSSTYFNDDFILLENEISKLSSKGNILIIGDLNARVSNHLDFISDENNIHDDLLNLLPDDYLGDSHIYRNSLDKVLNPHGKQLIDLCIASRLRILNGRFVGDLFGNVTCYKHNGSSTVDYALSDMDLMSSIEYFYIGEPTYLSDHVPISVILKCNICHTEHKSHKNFTQIGVKYRWENTSRDKMIEVLGENFIKQQIRDFEDSQFEQTFSGIDKATSDIKNIFESLANKSCKICLIDFAEVHASNWLRSELRASNWDRSASGTLLPIGVSRQRYICTASNWLRKDRGYTPN